jgi:hypothetical protein
VERIVIATDGSPKLGPQSRRARAARRLGASVRSSRYAGRPLFGDPALIRHLCDELRETRV